MKKTLIPFLLFMIASGVACLAAEAGADAAAGSTKKPKARSKVEAGSTAEKKAQDLRITPDPKLPNVLLLGDSISIGYHQAVSKRLAGKANVFRPVRSNGAAENCSHSGYGVENLDRWLSMQPKWDVIHFNWGLHDIKRMKREADGSIGNATSSSPDDPRLREVDAYAAMMAKIVARLKRTGAKLIFATTTPVVPGTTNPLRSPEDPPRYNEAAVRLMKSQGIAVNDLHAFASPRLAALQRPKNVHFTDEGSDQLGAQVAQAIEAQLAGRAR